MNEYKSLYENKMLPVEKAAEFINSGDHIWAGIHSCVPYALVNAISDRYEELENVEIVSALLAQPVKCATDMKYAGKVHWNSIFAGPYEREYQKVGNLQVISANFSETAGLIKDQYKVRVLIAECSEMDGDGYLYFGPQGSAWNGLVAEYAEKIILSVNKYQHKAEGTYNRIHISRVNALCRDDHPLYELVQPDVTETDKQIAAHIVPLVPDGATLQIGLGGIANAVAYDLKDKKDMSIHTEILTDSLAELIECNAVNGKVLAGLALGNNKTFEMCENGQCHVAPLPQVNNPWFASQNDNFISINSCLMADLTGQVASESIGYRQYSCTGGQLDFVMAANYSKGGKTFLCMKSAKKNKDGSKSSNIMLSLPQGQAVTSPRSLVQYVVTEYGCAHIANKSVRERANALIAIAHPDFRDELRSQAMAACII